MPDIHSIRLRSVWKSEPAAEGVRYRRGFNRPTGLAAHERVFLVVDRVGAPARVALNGEVLGEVRGAASARFEITQRLQPHNELTFEVTGSADTAAPPAGQPGGPIGEVRLEIESASQSGSWNRSNV